MDEVPAYSLKSYILSPSRLSKQIIPEDIYSEYTLKIETQAILTIDPDLKNFSYKVCLDKANDLKSLFIKEKCLDDQFSLNYEFYESADGKGDSAPASGAYIFQPRSNDKEEYSTVRSGRVFQGRYLSIVQVRRFLNLGHMIRFLGMIYKLN